MVTPVQAQTLFEKAREYHHQGQAALAENAYRQVINLDSRHAGAHQALGLLLFDRGESSAAIEHLTRASDILPDWVEPLVQRGQALQQLGYPADALACFDRALALRPTGHVALYQRGVVLQALQRSAEAVASFDALLALQPDFAPALFSRANALAEAGRFEDAHAAYERVIALQPDLADAIRNRGMLRLLLGDFNKGFADYEHRRPRSGPKSAALAAIPEWTGGDIAGKSLLVSDASGLGDTLQFCRYLPLLVARGARVSFTGQPRLFRLLRSLEPSVRLVAELGTAEHFDLHCKLLSVPFLFGTLVNDVPRSVPYLSPEPERIAHWATRLGGEGFKVGICWQGNATRSMDAGRSIPLSEFAPLVALPHLRLISLQKNFGVEQLAGLPAGRVETLGEDFDNGPDAFIDSAAVIANLDLVISSDTSIAHLAGALARPAWVALRAVPEWRWLLKREDSPWYPSLRLFRQPVAGDWTSVFTAMAARLSGELTR